MSKCTLISNPGSSSGKYGIHRDGKLIAAFYFDSNGGHPQCFIKKDGFPETVVPVKSAKDGAYFLKEFLAKEGITTEDIDAIMIRVVASGDYFAKDHVVDGEYLLRLDKLISEQHPLHAPIVMDEILKLEKTFGDTHILAISDSSFHSTRPDKSKYYAINPVVADTYDIKRYGAHGLSMESVIQKLQAASPFGLIPNKLIVCHIGSGVSVTAIQNGASVETTMGYTPLEGVMMGTRCGNIDVAAAIALKKFMGYSDEELIKALNLHSGLRGIGGSGDFRDIDRQKEVEFDEDSGKLPSLAYEMFVYSITKAVGEMAAVMNGVDALVFAATISERNPQIRTNIVKNLDFLGFQIDESKNIVNLDSDVFDISDSHWPLLPCSKPIYVVKIDEAQAMLSHKSALIGG